MAGISILNWFTVIVVCMLIPTLVLADYQIELDLRSYNNSGGRRSDTTCCDATIPNTQICFPGDTCDTRLNFNVRNFDTNQMYIDQTKTVGDYDGMDIINFMNCSQLINGQGNPLVFVIDPTTWTLNEEIQFTVEVLDIDLNQATGMTDREEIGIIIVRIGRPSAPNAMFTMYQNYTGGFAQLELRYRVICTTGTCGSTCSQTTSCNPFPSACSTTVTPVDCGDSPCQNGGTCNTIPGGYMCECPEAYSGQNCEQFDACFSSPCDNDGTCNRVPGSNDFSCTCLPPYAGTTCTDRVTTASPNDTPRTPTSDGTETQSRTGGTMSADETMASSFLMDTTVDSGAAGRFRATSSIMLTTLSLFLILGLK